MLWFKKPNREEDALAAISTAYLLLLRMPQGGVRARNQACLSALRDALASETGGSAEDTQDFYEYFAIHHKPPPKTAVARA